MTALSTIITSLACLLGPGDTLLCHEPEDIFSVECSPNGCVARWDDWLTSPVWLAYKVESWPEVEPATVWECDPEPAVDLCRVTSANGDVGCFRVRDGWAVQVTPCCAVEGDTKHLRGVGQYMVTWVY